MSSTPQGLCRGSCPNFIRWWALPVSVSRNKPFLWPRCFITAAEALRHSPTSHCWSPELSTRSLDSSSRQPGSLPFSQTPGDGLPRADAKWPHGPPACQAGASQDVRFVPGRRGLQCTARRGELEERPPLWHSIPWWEAPEVPAQEEVSCLGPWPPTRPERREVSLEAYQTPAKLKPGSMEDLREAGLG